MNFYNICYGAWCGLGFVRGIQYDIYHNTKNSDTPRLYLHSILMGFVGSVIYCFPVLWPFIAYKEIYRLEVNIRNIEQEKNKSTFYELL